MLTTSASRALGSGWSWVIPKIRGTRSMGEIFTEQSTRHADGDQQPEQGGLTPGGPVTYHRSAFDVPGSDRGAPRPWPVYAALAIVKAEWLRGFGGARRENATMLILNRP